MKTKLIILIILVAAFLTGFSQQKTDTNEKGVIKISVMYPAGEGKFFNMDYYQSKHMPMVANWLGSNLIKYTIEKGIENGMADRPLPFIAIGTFYVKSLNEYQSAIAPKRDSIRADFPNYTNISPVILVSEIVR